jgi:hypothetical protein
VRRGEPLSIEQRVPPTLRLLRRLRPRCRCASGRAALAARARRGLRLRERQRASIRRDLQEDERGEGADRKAPARSPPRALRPQRQPAPDGEDVARQAGAGGSAGQAACGDDLGKARRDEPGGDSREGALPEGLLTAPASPPLGGRHALSRLSHQRDVEADQAGSDALRPRLRHPRPVPPRVSSRHLPHDAPRPRRRLEGGARHAPELLPALQGDPQPEAARGPEALGLAVSAAAVQPHR